MYVMQREKDKGKFIVSLTKLWSDAEESSVMKKSQRVLSANGAPVFVFTLVQNRHLAIPEIVDHTHPTPIQLSRAEP